MAYSIAGVAFDFCLMRFGANLQWRKKILIDRRLFNFGHFAIRPGAPGFTDHSEGHREKYQRWSDWLGVCTPGYRLSGVQCCTSAERSKRGKDRFSSKIKESTTYRRPTGRREH